MSNDGATEQFLEPPVISKPRSKTKMVAAVFSYFGRVSKNAWRPQLWIASFMAIGWAVVSVILIIDLMKGVEDVGPIIKEAGDISSLHIEQVRIEKERLKKEYLEKVRRWIGDLEQQLFDERAKRREGETKEKEVSQKLRDKQAEMASKSNDAHKAGLVGNDPFAPPPKPTGFIDSWWDYFFSDLEAKCKEYNDTYTQMNAAKGAYIKGLQDAKAAIATAAKRIDELQGLSRSYQEELSEKSHQPEAVPEVVIVEVSQSPWLKTVLFIIHATIIPITLILVLSSLLRVIVLAEWLEPMRLVSK